MRNIIQKIITTCFVILMVFVSIPQESAFLPESVFALNAEEEKKKESAEVWVTAYSSTPEETDSTPFITASGMRVRDGLIAANFLPFGTKVKIPEFFGDKVFVVQDRMHRRKTNNVDIWMPSKDMALNFGRHRAEIVVVERPKDPLLADASPR